MRSYIEKKRRQKKYKHERVSPHKKASALRILEHTEDMLLKVHRYVHLPDNCNYKMISSVYVYVHTYMNDTQRYKFI